MHKRTAFKLAGLTTAVGAYLWLTRGGKEGSPIRIGISETEISDVSPLATPTYEQFGAALWLSAYARINNPDLIRRLYLLDSTLPDPLIKARVAEVLLDNFAASQPGGAIDRNLLLRQAGQAYGFNLCGDSRIICQTVYSIADPGRQIAEFEVATVEQRSLGAAPRIFEKGIDISLLATHCNSVTDPTGCGALAGIAKLAEPGGADYLLNHGIDENTIHEIQRTLSVANPDEQAIIAARIQARINAVAHGQGHITVATKIGHDGSWTILGAFDESGKTVQVPEILRDVVAINRADVTQIDAFLARGQKPFEIVLNATPFNIQDLFGQKAALPGYTFKITGRPQTAQIGQLLNVAEVDQAVAGVNYPLAHDWAHVQWIVGNTPEELALIKDRLYRSPKIWEFLGRNGYLIEAIVDEKGQMVNSLKITRLANLTDLNQGIENLRAVGTTSVEIKLSQTTLAEAEATVTQAEARGTLQAAKWRSTLEALKHYGKIALKILQPLADAGTAIWAAEIYQRLNAMGTVYREHALKYVDGRSGAITSVMTDAEYQASLAEKPYLEPYLYTGRFETVYTQAELGQAFLGLVKKYTSDIDNFGGNWTEGPANRSSEFYGMGLGDLYKFLEFDYFDPNDRQQQHKIFHNFGSPLIFMPQPIQTAFSPNHISYTEEGIGQQPFIILNTENGEFLTTDSPGQMIVPVIGEKSLNGVKAVYYLSLVSDGEGKIAVTTIGYQEPAH